MSKLLPCRKCGKPAITERWSSGGMMYMAKCSNPDCELGEEITHTKGRDLKQVIEDWNFIQKTPPAAQSTKSRGNENGIR